MNKIIGILWGLLFCLLLSIVGCKTKKEVTKDYHSVRTDSLRKEHIKTETHFCFVDTTKVDEFTTTIREYIFSVPDCVQEVCANECVTDTARVAHLTNEVSKRPFVPMFERKADGSIVIHHGLKRIKEQTISRRNERKGVSKQQDSTSNSKITTNVRAAQEDKHKDKNIERVQVTEPFDWWQLIVGVTILLAVVIGLLYLNRRTPWVRKIFAYVRKSH